jgi:predicted RNA methylase
MATAKKTTKGGANGYAALVKKRAANKAAGVKPKRHKLDAYETPSQHTRQLMENFHIPAGATITEPAAGSGRMARELRAFGSHKVITSDIKDGQDFTKRTAKIKGHCVTNPPYRDGLADAFVNKALELTEGVVCMLMEAKYLFGSKRFDTLFGPNKPQKVILIPERIYFFDGHSAKAKPIESQFYNHVWVCWPDRASRGKVAKTEIVWAKPSPETLTEFG